MVGLGGAEHDHPADRTGKGMRTAPRDAMISLAAPKTDVGLAIGVQRAILPRGDDGQLIAFALLSQAQWVHLLFLISFFVAVLGFLVLTMLVRDRVRRPLSRRRSRI